jgi:hypothetical protein
MGCPQGPIRISQEFAVDDDCIRLSGTDYVLSLDRRCDHSDRPGQDVGFPAGPAMLETLDPEVRCRYTVCHNKGARLKLLSLPPHGPDNVIAHQLA